MSPPSSYTQWNQPRPQSPHGSIELDDELFSEFSSTDSELASSEFEEENDEFHEEEFAGILALAEQARESFAASSSRDDLEEYIAYLRDALTVAPRDGQARAEILHTLAHNLYLSATYVHSPAIDSLERLDESIHLHRLALYHLPHGNEARGDYATDLAIVLRERYSQSSDPDDLHDSIALHLQALSFRPPGHPDRFQSLTNLANCHFARFECLGNADDLESAINCDSEALALLTPDHPNKVSALLALAADLGARFGRDGSQSALQQSTSLYKEALSLTTAVEDSLRIAQQLASLLFVHYRTSHTIAVLDEAIGICSRPLGSGLEISKAAQLPAVRLLADLCLTRYLEGSQEAQYLEGAIQYCKQSLEYLLEESSLSEKLNALMNLSYALVARFSLTKGVADIDQSIQLCAQAAHLSRPEHPSHCRSLRALARSFAIRYEHFSHERDIQLAFEKYAEAVRNPYGFIRERIAYAEEWVELILRFKGQSPLLLEAYASMICLLRHLIYFEDNQRLREEDIKIAGRVMSGSLQCALSLNDMEKVVELLEQRQEMLWSPRYLDDAIPPPLRQRLHSIARELHGSCSGQSSLASSANSSSYQRRANADDVASRHRNLVEEFHSLLQHLRSYPGLSNLLRPVRFCELTLGRHPAIWLVAEAHCEAIVCCSSVVSRVTLDLTVDDARKLACEFQNMQFSMDQAVFQTLSERAWTTIVKPVLDVLRFTAHPSEPKPRLWWCPTGPFVFIPLHAVGRSQADKRPICTFDYAVSSYAPSINSLQSFRQAQSKSTKRTRKASLPTPINTDLPPFGTPCPAQDDCHLFQIPSPIGSDGLSFSFGYDIDNPSEGRRASFIRLTGPLPDDTLPTSPRSDSSHLSYASTSSNLPYSAPSYVAFALLHPQNRPSNPMTTMPGLPCESSHAGFTLLSGGFRSIISTVPGWQNLLHPDDTAMVIERVCKDIESTDASDIDPSIVPYALDNAVCSLLDSGIPLTRLIPFIHIGL